LLPIRCSAIETTDHGFDGGATSELVLRTEVIEHLLNFGGKF
jgi:hypothetical protein